MLRIAAKPGLLALVTRDPRLRNRSKFWNASVVSARFLRLSDAVSRVRPFLTRWKCCSLLVGGLFCISCVRSCFLGVELQISSSSSFVLWLSLTGLVLQPTVELAWFIPLPLRLDFPLQVSQIPRVCCFSLACCVHSVSVTLPSFVFLTLVLFCASLGSQQLWTQHDNVCGAG